eukprot:131027-Rhodomonas_salina.1
MSLDNPSLHTLFDLPRLDVQKMRPGLDFLLAELSFRSISWHTFQYQARGKASWHASACTRATRRSGIADMTRQSVAGTLDPSRRSAENEAIRVVCVRAPACTRHGKPVSLRSQLRIPNRFGQ